MFATKEHMDTTDAHFACWTNCYVSIDNSWINPAALSKEVGRILKIRLEKMEQNAAENEEKLKAALSIIWEAGASGRGECSSKREEQEASGTLEAIGVLNKQLKDQKETHMEVNARLKKRTRSNWKLSVF